MMVLVTKMMTATILLPYIVALMAIFRLIMIMVMVMVMVFLIGTKRDEDIAEKERKSS